MLVVWCARYLMQGCENWHLSKQDATCVNTNVSLMVMMHDKIPFGETVTNSNSQKWFTLGNACVNVTYYGNRTLSIQKTHAVAKIHAHVGSFDNRTSHKTIVHFYRLSFTKYTAAKLIRALFSISMEKLGDEFLRCQQINYLLASRIHGIKYRDDLISHLYNM